MFKSTGRSIFFISASFLALGQAKPLHAQKIGAQLVVSDLDRPVFVTAPQGDTERIFILEQYLGQILIVKNGQLWSQPFLDIGNLVSNGAPHQGLLGMAFHPRHAENGFFFIQYTDVNGDTMLERYRVYISNPDVAMPESAATIFTLSQPTATHNGSMLAFGPQDGYLYVGQGDGVYGGDPGNFAQDGQLYYGKVLRLDVDRSLPYAIPPDNPFVGDPNFLDEIWIYGLRSPWRFSFDRSNGDFYLGDVGESDWEEVNYAPHSVASGKNFGWRLKEGDQCFNPPSNCDPGTLLDPVHVYAHEPEPGLCAVMSGYVYRGKNIPGLEGTYFFGDFCTATFWSFRMQNGGLVDYRDRTPDLNPNGSNLRTLSSFGEDGLGELYFCDLDGAVFKIVSRQMEIEAGPVIGGQAVSGFARGATPGEKVYFFYTKQGRGQVHLPSLDVYLGLNAPVLHQGSLADASGEAAMSGVIPDYIVDRTMWIQAAENGNSSNILERVVQ